VRSACAFEEHGLTADPNTSENRTQSAVQAELRPEKHVVAAAALRALPGHTVGHYRSGLDLWLHRTTVLMFVFVCAVVGVLLVILPWRPEWTDNHLLLAYPGLRAFVANGFVRGICSGLGLLDIWIGFWEAIHYGEMTAAK
jgi:hypothetical protein